MKITLEYILRFFLVVTFFLFYNCSGQGQKKGDVGRTLTFEEAIQMNQNQVKGEQYVIKKFVEDNNLNMQVTGTGLWYKITKTRDGIPVEKDKVISLNYEVMLMDSTICYSSDEDGVKTFLVGRGGVESGLEEGILLLKEGDEATFILPSHLAHGLVGDDNKIPSRAIIQYKVEVLKVKDK